ncbi:hypothetical protein D3C72_1968640 [compost metagenome]
MRGEQAAQPGDRRHARKLRGERLGREHPAAQHQRRGQRGHAEQQQQRQEGEQAVPYHQAKARQHARGIEGGFPLEAQRALHDLVQAAAQMAAQRPQAGHAGDQHDEGGELARTHYLPLLARLFQAPG